MNGLSTAGTGVVLNYVGGWMGHLGIGTTTGHDDRFGCGIYFARLSSESCDARARGWLEIDHELGPIGYVPFLMGEQEGADLKWGRSFAMDLESTLPSILIHAIANIKFGPATKEWLPINQVGLWTGVPSWLPRHDVTRYGDTTTYWNRLHFGFQLPSLVIKEGEILRFHKDTETELGGISLPYAAGGPNKRERGATSALLVRGKLEDRDENSAEIGAFTRSTDYSLASMLSRDASQGENQHNYKQLGSSARNSRLDRNWFPIEVCPPYMRLTLHNEGIDDTFMTDTPDLDDVWAGVSFGIVSNNYAGPYKYFWGLRYHYEDEYYLLSNNPYITWMDYYPYLAGSRPRSLGMAYYYLAEVPGGYEIQGEVGAFMFDILATQWINYLDVPVTLDGDITISNPY